MKLFKPNTNPKTFGDAHHFLHKFFVELFQESSFTNPQKRSLLDMPPLHWGDQPTDLNFQVSSSKPSSDKGSPGSSRRPLGMLHFALVLARISDDWWPGSTNQYVYQLDT